MNTHSINRIGKLSLLLALLCFVSRTATYAQGYGQYGNSGSCNQPYGYGNGQPYGYNQGYGYNNGYGPNNYPNYPYGNQYGQYSPSPYLNRPPVVVVPVPPIAVPAPPVVIVQRPHYYTPFRQPWGRAGYYGYRPRLGHARRW